MTDDSEPERTVRRARRELDSLLHDPPPAEGLGPGGAEWHRLYVQRISRFLLEHLEDRHLRLFEIPFTALHELVAVAFAARPLDTHALCEHEAWSAVAAEEHLAIAHTITQMPAWVDPLTLVPLMRAFIRFLAAEGAMDAVDAERLDHEYAGFDPTEVPRAVA